MYYEVAPHVVFRYIVVFLGVLQTPIIASSQATDLSNTSQDVDELEIQEEEIELGYKQVDAKESMVRKLEAYNFYAGEDRRDIADKTDNEEFRVLCRWKKHQDGLQTAHTDKMTCHSRSR
ncbi:hypothetical protein Tco_0816153 [Tanacetum coccineum]